MILNETSLIEKKSIRILEKNQIKELIKEFVSFANAKGGKIYIGIEDDGGIPPPNQHINDYQLAQFIKRINELTINVRFNCQKLTAPNDSNYLECSVLPCSSNLACTTDGKYYTRDGDSSRPLRPEEMSYFMTDRPAFSWELKTTNFSATEYDEQLFIEFLDSIKSSDRVSTFIKGKSHLEILEYYFLIKDNRLTNLGALCIGTREQRAALITAPIVQAIKYDEAGHKIQKWLWDDLTLPPWKLEKTVLNTIPEWKESYELPDGLFRKHTPIYDTAVIRELLSNAFVHKPYTQSGDISIKFYPEYMEIVNPGPLPAGVTPQNILHTSIKRNENLSKIFYDLGLMEREGSGYDKIYEILLSHGKKPPLVTEHFDRVCIRINKRIIDPHIINFIAKADQVFQLTQKEKISLGLLAQEKSAHVMRLTRLLNLDDAKELTNWIGRLENFSLVIAKGKTRGKTYSIEPTAFRSLEFTGKTTLGAIEPHRLKALIEEDLKIHQSASLDEIRNRIGQEIPTHKVRVALKNMIREGLIQQTGRTKWTRYVYLKK